MKPVRVYEYAACSTCKSALKYLEAHGISYEKFPIVDRPPTMAELKRMLGHLKDSGGSLKSLFNTSGVQYRELKIAEKLPKLSEADALKLLSGNGKLIKRPFLLTADGGTVGFKKESWDKLLKV